jgi:hypothetical protein
MKESDDLPVALAGNICIVGCLVALGIWGRQIYWYAKQGVWTEHPLTDALYWMTGAEWLIRPHDWLGIHAALASINAGFASLMVGIISAWLIILVDQ